MLVGVNSNVLMNFFIVSPRHYGIIYVRFGSYKFTIRPLSQFLERKNIKFMGDYNNDDIDSILKKIDVLIVPSLWYENSPLVIQESFFIGCASDYF